jgi:glycine oxidase
MKKSNSSVIVIGGGIIGLSCAYRLAQKGLNVKVFEADECGGKSTTAALGFLIPYVPTIKKPIALLQRESVAMYPSFAQELLEESGIDIGYSQLGHLQVLYSEKQYEKAVDTVAKSNQLNETINGKKAFEILSLEESQKLEPNLKEAKYGCLLSRLTANVSTTHIIQALKIVCQKLNVQIIENTPIEEIIITNGTATGIKTKDNEFFADNILIATGAFSSKFADIIPNLNEILPQKGEAIELKLKEKKFDMLIKVATFYIACKEDGTTLIGSTSSRKPDFTTQVSEKSIKMLLKGGKRIIPEINESQIVRAWAGLRPHSYLGSPLIGKCNEAKNLFVATGHGKIGICTAPFTAKIISNLIADDIEIIDLTPYNVNKLKQPGSKE